MSEDELPASGSDEPEKKRSLFSKIRIGAVVLVLILTLVVIFQNTESVETNILFMKLIMPRAILLILTFLLGAVAGLLIAYVRGRKHRE